MLVQSNDPRNLCAESLYPCSYGIGNWIVTSICHRQLRLTALSFHSVISRFKTNLTVTFLFVGFDAVKTNIRQHQGPTFPLLWTWGKCQVALAVLRKNAPLMSRFLVWVEISEVLQWFIFWDHILVTFLLDNILYMKKYVLFIVVFFFPRSILVTSFWIPSERTLIMWCSYVKAKRSPPITWGISWVTWLRVRVAFSFTLTRKIIIFYCTNLT